MGLEYQILVAVFLDLVLGDPEWFPHPVRLMGRLAAALEQPFRRLIKAERAAGIATALAVISTVVVTTYAIVRLAHDFHPIVGDAISVFVIYTGLAAKDLLRHGMDVWKALEQGDIEKARSKVSKICGRDVDRLDESGIVKATVESVAENMVDGVTAPLFYAVIAGPVGIIAYKAVSTLDSMFGYKNERYVRFGWASARLDDAAAFIPSRLTAILVPPAAMILGWRFTDSIRILVRDRGKHPSPNAGQCEAAFAGALGVQLGGLSHYGGKPSEKPKLGDPIENPNPDLIQRASALMLTTSLLCLALLLGLSILCHYVYRPPA